MAVAPEGEVSRVTYDAENPKPDGAMMRNERSAVAKHPTPHSTHHPDTARPTPPYEVFPVFPPREALLHPPPQHAPPTPPLPRPMGAIPPHPPCHLPCPAQPTASPLHCICKCAGDLVARDLAIESGPGASAPKSRRGFIKNSPKSMIVATRSAILIAALASLQFRCICLLCDTYGRPRNESVTASHAHDTFCFLT